MNTIDSLKTILPASFKRRLRDLHRIHTLRGAIGDCRASLHRQEEVPDELVERLIYGWGNEGWSAKSSLIRALLDEHIDSQTMILECGTGLSTLVFGLISAQTNARVISLEHDENWYRQICDRFATLGLSSAGIRYTPLKNYGDYDWYDVAPLHSNEKEFSLALCDGPPSDTLGGRYGLLPVLIGQIRSGARIIVDDTMRENERAMIEQWSKEFAGRLEINGVNPSYAVLTIR